MLCPWYSLRVRIFVLLLCLAWLLLVVPLRVQAVEHTLRVANLHDDAFAYFIRGAIRRGEGELAMPGLEQAVDSASIGGGGLIYDRDIHAAGDGIAQSFGAVTVRPTGYSATVENGSWKAVRWEGKPGDRVVWVIRPSTTHFAEVRHLAVSGPQGELRYFIPYSVTVSPTRSRAVAYSLTLLRSGENGRPLWQMYLSRAVDLKQGAAVVGRPTIGADWVYVVIEPPPEATTFSVAIGWTRRGSSDRILAGTGGTGGTRR